MERSDIWCTRLDGYKGKHIEETRLCHSGNMAEYIYTHTCTHERLPHTIIMIKNQKKSHSHKKYKFEIINSTSVCQIIISSPLRKRTKLHSV